MLVSCGWARAGDESSVLEAGARNTALHFFTPLQLGKYSGGGGGGGGGDADGEVPSTTILEPGWCVAPPTCLQHPVHHILTITSSHPSTSAATRSCKNYPHSLEGAKQPSMEIDRLAFL